MIHCNPPCLFSGAGWLLCLQQSEHVFQKVLTRYVEKVIYQNLGLPNE